MQEVADHFGIILDKGWEGLTETEAAWNLVTRLAFGMECFVGVALALCVVFEMTGRFRLADNLAIALFAIDMLSNMVPCLVNFECKPPHPLLPTNTVRMLSDPTITFIQPHPPFCHPLPLFSNPACSGDFSRDGLCSQPQCTLRRNGHRRFRASHTASCRCEVGAGHLCHRRGSTPSGTSRCIVMRRLGAIATDPHHARSGVDVRFVFGRLLAVLVAIACLVTRAHRLKPARLTQVSIRAPAFHLHYLPHFHGNGRLPRLWHHEAPYDHFLDDPDGLRAAVRALRQGIQLPPVPAKAVRAWGTNGAPLHAILERLPVCSCSQVHWSRLARRQLPAHGLAFVHGHAHGALVALVHARPPGTVCCVPFAAFLPLLMPAATQALALYLATDTLDVTLPHLLHTLVTSPSFWLWFVREVAEVCIGLRVLGQVIYGSLRTK